jgi:hypothetical protein
LHSHVGRVEASEGGERLEKEERLPEDPLLPDEFLNNDTHGDQSGTPASTLQKVKAYAKFVRTNTGRELVLSMLRILYPWLLLLLMTDLKRQCPNLSKVQGS